MGVNASTSLTARSTVGWTSVATAVRLETAGHARSVPTAGADRR
jgi:hypothetical protein